MIETKKVFMLRKGKMYLLSRKEREEVYVFIEEKLRKEYIRLSKSSQMASIFFIEKKDGKKHMVFFFFFFINNLLHGSWWKTVVATFITTYKGSILT